MHSDTKWGKKTKHCRSKFRGGGSAPAAPPLDSPLLYLKSFIAKRVNSILVNLRYLRFKLLKYIRKIVILLIITSKIFLDI